MIKRIISKYFDGGHSRRKVNVAMFHIGRCGSTVLGSMLAKNRNVRWGSEVFEGEGNKNFIDSKSYICDVLNKNGFNEHVEIFGFETKYLDHLHLNADNINLPLESYIDVLAEIGFEKFILIHRLNYLKRVVSGEVGHATKVWHSTQPSTLNRILINPLSYNNGGKRFELVEYLQCLDESYARIRAKLANYQCLELIYEDDILDDPYKAYVKTCGFLDLKMRKVSIDLKRTNPFPLRESVINYSELELLLQDTKYAWMLND